MVPDGACVRSGQDVPFVSVLGQKGVMEGRVQHDKTVGYVVIAGSVFHVCLTVLRGETAMMGTIGRNACI